MTNEKVLIVDDDISFALGIEIMLSQMGYEIEQANTFATAKDKILNSNFDIVISDIVLDNNKTGIDLAKEINNIDLPFVFMTSYNDIQNYENSKSYKRSSFIVKPFDKLTLKGLLDQHLKKEKIELTGSYISNNKIYLKHLKAFEQVSINDIIHLNSEGNYCYLHANSKKYILKISLTKLLGHPSFKNFIRVHRNHAVNLNHIKSVNFNNKKIHLEKEEIPIGKSFLKSTREVIMAKKV